MICLAGGRPGSGRPQGVIGVFLVTYLKIGDLSIC
jgi:hypothetical protein